MQLMLNSGNGCAPLAVHKWCCGCFAGAAEEMRDCWDILGGVPCCSQPWIPPLLVPLPLSPLLYPRECSMLLL